MKKTDNDTQDSEDKQEYERGDEIPGQVSCPDCGFTDRADNFDKIGMDLQCPSCGHMGVR